MSFAVIKFGIPRNINFFYYIVENATNLACYGLVVSIKEMNYAKKKIKEKSEWPIF